VEAALQRRVFLTDPGHAIELLVGALDDVDEALRFYLDRSTNAYDRFRREFRLAIRQIEEFPRSGRPLDHGLREMGFHSFHYSLIYRVAARRSLWSRWPMIEGARATGSTAEPEQAFLKGARCEVYLRHADSC
jgi:plasmid stabilization system protein ParE